MRKQLLLALVAFMLLMPLGINAQRATVYLSENFNASSTDVPTTWDASTYSTSSYKWKGSADGRNSTSCAYLYTYSSNTAALKSPAISLPSNRDCMLTFWLKNSASSAADLDVYVSTDGGATYQNNPLVTNLDDGGTWTEHVVLLSAYRGQSIKLVFVGQTNGTNSAYFYLDDLSVQTVPTCQAATNAYASALQDTQVDLNWGLAGTGFGDVPDSFAIRLVSGGNELSNTTYYMAPTGGAYVKTLTGLTPNTTYTVYISSNCMANYAGTNPEETQVTFTTPMTALALPYEEFFDNITSLPSGSYGHNATINSSYSYTAGGHSAQLTVSAADNAWLLLPPLDVQADQFEMDFRVYSTSTSRPRYYVGYATDPSDVGSTFVPMLYDSVVMNGIWHSYRFNTANTGDNTRPIMPCILVDGGQSQSVFFDEIRVHAIPTCIRPEHVTCTAFDDVSATFTWDTSNASTVLFYVADVNDNPLFTATANSQPYTITGLTGQTTYKIRLRGICSGNDSTDLTDPYLLTTQCGKVTTYPVSQNFEDASFSQCWRTGRTGTSANPQRSTSHPANGSYGFYMPAKTAGNYSWIATPPLQFTAGQSYYFSMNMYRGANYANNTNEMVQVYLSSTPDDIAGATLLGTVCQNYQNAPAEAEAGIYPYYFAIPATATGTQYMVVRYQSQNGSGAYVDDLTVAEGTFCAPLRGVAENIAETQADINVNSTVAQWQVAYGPQGTDVANMTKADVNNAQSYTITGLTDKTLYDYYTRRICGAGDTSDWSAVRTFATTAFPAQAPYACGFEDLAENSAWDIITADNSYNIGTATGAVYSGSRALYVISGNTPSPTAAYGYNQNTTADTYASRLVNFGTGEYIVSFKWKCPGGESCCDYATVYLAPVGTNISASTGTSFPAGSIQLGGNSEGKYNMTTDGTLGNYWNEYQTTLDMTGREGNWMLVFHWHNDGSLSNGSPMAIDDVVISSNSCPRPENVAFNLGNLSAPTVTWTAGGQETEWAVDARLSQGTQAVFDTTFLTTATTATLPAFTLQSNTEYNAYAAVRAICQAGDTSAAASAGSTFTTPCDPVALPLTEDFGSTVFPPQCWQTGSTGSSSVARNTSSNAHTTGCVYFPDQLLGNYSWLVSPLIDFDADSTYRLNFWAYRASTAKLNEGIYIYVMDDLSTLNQETPTGTFVGSVIRKYDATPVEAAVGTYEYEFYLPQGLRGAKYVVFRYLNEYGSSMYVDDISIEAGNWCPKIAPQLIGLDDISLTFQIDTARNWQLAYGPQGTAVENCTLVNIQNAQSYFLGNLTPSTTYSYYARLICAPGDTSDWSSENAFTTVADVGRLPYNCGFENDAENSQWHMMTSASAHNFIIGEDASGVRTGSKALYVSNNATTGTYAYNNGSSAAVIAYRPILFGSDVYQVEFKWKANGESSSYDFGRVMLVPVESNMTTGGTGSYSSASYPVGAIFLDGDYGDRLNNASSYVETGADGWNKFNLSLDMAGRAGVYNLTFYWMHDSSSGTNPPLAVDDIHVYELTCYSPNVVPTNLSDSTATISFNQSGVSEWEVVFDTASINTEVLDTNAVSYHAFNRTGSCSFSGLTPNTRYYYSVRSICGVGDTSQWTDVAYLNTYCSAYGVPYTEGFETATSANCWTPLDDGTGSAASAIMRSGTSHIGTSSLRVTAATAVSPEFLVDSLAEYMLEGWVYSTSDSAQVGIGVMYDPSDASSFELLSNVLIPQRNTWTPFTAYFTALNSDDYADPDMADFRYAKHVAMATGEYTVYFDDLYLGLTPDCPKPTEPHLTNITSSSFDISFVDNAQAHAWTVTVVSGTDTLTYPITSNPATITGLTQHSEYEVYVAAECGGTAGTSLKTYCGVISTQCDEQRLPYAESFESLPTSRIEGMESDMCWNSLNAWTGSYPYFYATTTASYVSDGSRALQLTSGSSTPLFVIMPKFRSYPGIRMTYDVKMESSSSSGNLYIGYLTDANDASSFVGIDTILKSATSMTTYTTNFTALPASARIAFKYADASSSNYWCWIDNIRAIEVRACEGVDMPTIANITHNSADVIFTDPDTAHQAWEWRLTDDLAADPDSLPQGTIVTTKDTIALTGLTENTNYAFYVRAICGAGDTSAWMTANFHSRCIPFHVTLNDTLFDDFEWTGFQEPVVGCYDVTASGSASYYVQGYANTRTNATPPVYNYYCRSGYRNIKVYTYNGTNPQGLTFYRQVRLDAGRVYQASIYALSVSNSTSVTLGYNTVADLTGATLIANRVLDPYTPQSGTTTEGYAANIYNTGLQEITGFFSVPQDGLYFIGVNTMGGNGSSTGDAYYDDFSISELSGCLPVTNISVDTVTDVTARFTITDTVASEYDYYVANLTTGDTAVALTTTSSTTIDISGLGAVTTYALYVRRNCGAGSVSPWNNTVFTTECGAITTFPFRESFENAVPPQCWSQSQYGSHNGNFARSANYSHSGSYSAYKNDQSSGTKTALLTPELALTSPRGYKVALWVYRQGSSYQSYTDEGFTVYMTQEENLTNANIDAQVELGFVPSHYLNPPVEAGSGWYRYEYSVPAQCVGNWRVAVQYHNRYGTGGCFDDLEVFADTVCLAPVAPVINAYTATTIDVATPLATTYGMLVGVAQGASSTVADVTSVDTVHTANHIITGLTPDSVYNVFVAKVCFPGDTSAWSPASTVTMRANDCFEPQNLRIVGLVDDCSAVITWDGAPQAIGYEYELVTGTTVAASGTVTLDTVSLTGLAASTSYTFRVRTLCPADTSAWATLPVRTTIGVNRLPFICDFESDAMRNTWQMGFLSGSANYYVVGQAASAVNDGAYSLYVTDDGSSYNYSTGAATESYAYANVLLPAGVYTASYDWKCYGESSYDYAFVYLLPENGTISAYSSMPANAISLCGTSYLNRQSSWQHYENAAVTVTTPGIYKLVVTWRNDGSAGTMPPFAIDNIFLGQITCPEPAGITVTNVFDTTATVTITKGVGNTAPLQWGYTEFGVIDSVANWTIDSTTAATMTAQLTGLAQTTRYTVFARQLCSGNDTSIVKSYSFSTEAPAAGLPFVCDFESADQRDQWTIVTTSGSNRLITGTDANGNNGGSYGLYTSSDGSTFNYDEDDASYSYAYVTLTIPAGTHSLSYDWKSYGENGYDYGQAYLLPSGGTIDVSSVPTGAISLMSGSDLQGRTGWTTYVNTNLNITNGGVYKLVFTWRNDGSDSDGDPMAVDNIVFGTETCQAPLSIAVSDITATSATATIIRSSANPIQWGYAQGVNRNNVTEWTVDSATTGNVVVNLAGLDSLTAYTLFARHVCDTADFSRYIQQTFRTVGTSDGDLPFFTGFEPADDNTVWTLTSATNHFMIGAGASHTGTQALYITNDGSSRGYNNSSAAYAYAYVTLNIPAGAYTVSYDWTCVGESSYDYGRAFIVPATTTIPVGQAMSGLSYGSLPAGAICIDNGDRMNTNTGGANWISERRSVVISTAGEYKIVFYWRDDTSSGSDPLAIDNFSIMQNENGGDVYDSICYNEPYMLHGLNLTPGAIQPGDTTFFTVAPGSQLGLPDTTVNIHIHMFGENITEYSDTACAGVPYTGHGFNIARPDPYRTIPYDRGPFTDHNGCDSTVRLNLYVIPTQETRYDTICLGDAFTLGTQTLTQAGQYTEVLTTSLGCPDTVTLNLFVVDTGFVQTATICQGDVYQFEGQNFMQTGTYRVSSTGAHGCPVNKTLVLTVLPTDTTVNATICSGGQVVVYDTIITTAGSYTMHRYDQAGCNVTWHINVTVAPPAEGHYTDDACEGRNYNNFGYYGPITADTVIMQTTKTSDMCDSITYVQVTFHPTQTSEFTDHLDENGRYDWNDNTYTQPGDYQGTFHDQFGCDSIVTLHLLPGDGVDNVEAAGSMKVVPNPVVKGQAAIVITQGVGEVVRVEIINSYGAVVDGWEPHSSPIDLRAPEASGVYHVRVIAKDGRVYVEKLIVQ